MYSYTRFCPDTWLTGQAGEVSEFGKNQRKKSISYKFRLTPTRTGRKGGRNAPLYKVLLENRENLKKKQ